MTNEYREEDVALPSRKKNFTLNTNAFKYLCSMVIYAGALISFTSKGWLCFAPMILTWVIIPCIELTLKPDFRNLSPLEEEKARHDYVYDYILYAMVIMQFPVVLLFLFSMHDEGLTWIDKVGRITAMGLFCGTCGINVGHELGHRVNKYEQALAKMSLMISLYMHNIIEHNKGHHKYVGTYNDPSTARFGEDLYTFWLRCIVYTYVNAWKIANSERRKKGKPAWSLRNEMLQFHLIQGALILLIWLCFGLQTLIYFLMAALMGILLLQSVGYIEHYGLARKNTGEGKFERVMPAHSWDSHHTMGRLLLFEVSRHSDHHYLASRKYQVLRYHDNAPQMPTGYPGMMILAMVPPAWFYVMNRRIRRSNVKTVTKLPN